MKKRVVVGLSGGVDSAVTAALLKDQGYDVIGVFALGWMGTPDFPCQWQTEEQDARAVAEHLGIDFHTINVSTEYEEAVINYFLDEYREGRTPNPDILCNSEIKFKALQKAIRQFEPDYFATGHYARIINKGPSYCIAKGKDPDKDQSYFLWNIDPEMLPHLLMPLGELRKTEVRQLAAKYNLPVAKKKDSQGICFIGPLRVREFLADTLKVKPGLAYTTDGKEIARHDGVQLYTIGQRLGAGSVDWTGDIPPLFVLAKDMARNILIVGQDHQLFSDSFTLRDQNWFSEQKLESLDCLVKVRYRGEDVPAAVSEQGNQIVVNLGTPTRAITPGQSAVFYSKTGEVLGGAVIDQVPAIEQLLASEPVAR